MRWVSWGFVVILAVSGCKQESKKEFYESETGMTVPYGQKGDKFVPTGVLLSPEEVAKSKLENEAHNYLHTVSLAKTPAEGRKMMEEGLKKFGTTHKFQLSYGTYLGFKLKERAEAVTHLKKFLKREPEDATAKACIGLLLMDLGKPDEAKTFLEDVEYRKVEVVTLDPSSSQLEMMLLFAHVTIGPENLREKELQTLVQFLPTGVRIADFNDAPYIKEAKASNRVDQEWIPKLAAVCKGKAKLDVLDDWEIMKHIRH